MTGSGNQLASPASPTLSPSQLAILAEVGEERTAAVGAVLYRVGDPRYPFVAIIEGEVAILSFSDVAVQSATAADGVLAPAIPIRPSA